MRADLPGGVMVPRRGSGGSAGRPETEEDGSCGGGEEGGGGGGGLSMRRWPINIYTHGTFGIKM